MANVFRDPVIGATAKQPWKAKAFDPPDLLTRSAVIVTPPFLPVLFDRPATLPFKAQEFNAPNLLFNTLYPTMPFSNSMLQPALAKEKSHAFFPVNMLPLHVTTTPFKTYDWQPALPRQKAIHFEPPNLCTSTLVPTVGFANYDWPNPQPGKARAQQSDPLGTTPIYLPPGIPPVIAPAGGHFIPTREELRRARERDRKAERARQREWDARLADVRDLRAQLRGEEASTETVVDPERAYYAEATELREALDRQAAKTSAIRNRADAARQLAMVDHARSRLAEIHAQAMDEEETLELILLSI